MQLATRPGFSAIHAHGVVSAGIQTGGAVLGATPSAAASLSSSTASRFRFKVVPVRNLSRKAKVDPRQTLAMLRMGALTPYGTSRSTYNMAMGYEDGIVELAAMNGHVRHLGSDRYADAATGEELSKGEIVARYREKTLAGVGYRELKSDLPIETPGAGQIPEGLRGRESDITELGKEGGIEKNLLKAMGLTKSQLRDLPLLSSSAGSLISPADQFALQGLYAMFDAAVKWGVRLDDIVGDDPQALGLAVAPGMGGMSNLVRLITASTQRAQRDPFTTKPGTGTYWLASLLADSMMGLFTAILGPKYKNASIGPNPVDVGACATGVKAFAQGADMFRPNWPGAGKVKLALFGSSEAPFGFPYSRPTATGFNAMGAMETAVQTAKALGVEPSQIFANLEKLRRGYAPMTKQVYGFRPTEGAGMGGITTVDLAFRLGIPITSRVLGYAIRGDHGGNTNPANIGYGAVNALRTSLEMSQDWQGVHPSLLQYFNGHLTGTPHSNQRQAEILKEVLDPSTKLFLIALKAFLGHGLGAAGSMEIALIQMILQHGVGPGAFHLEGKELDPAYADLDPMVRIVSEHIHGIEVAGGDSQGFAGNYGAYIFKTSNERSLQEDHGYSNREIRANASRVTEREGQASEWQENVNTGKKTIGQFFEWFGLGRKPLPKVRRFDLGRRNMGFGEFNPALAPELPPPENLAFIFPGQGSQKPGMGKALAEQFPAARKIFEEADAALGEALSKMIFEGPESDLGLTANTQPAILTTSIAAWTVFRQETGLASMVNLGHSLGEFSALVAAGGVNFPDAVRLVRLRGRAMQAAVPAGVGAMAAVIGMDAGDLEKLIAQASQESSIVSIANENGGGQFVVSGHADAVKKLKAMVGEANKKATMLNVSAPFHCVLMQPAAEALREALDRLTLNPLQVPVIANVTAKPNRDKDRVRDLLVEQAAGRVRWEASVLEAVAMGVQRFIELGNGKVLQNLGKRIAPEVPTTSIGTPEELQQFIALRKAG